MSTPRTAYRALPADERQEFRLPALLKDHLAQAAARTGETVAEYITDALAERVSRDLAAATEWALTVPEQRTLLETLAGAGAPSARARKAAARAAAMFGPIKPPKKRTR